jgi:type IV pilus assembly protein PilM
MGIVDSINGLLADPPPEFGFEVTEAGLAWASARGKGFAAFEPGTLRVSPSEENVLRADSLARAVREAAGEGQGRKRRTAALILPDHAGRTTVLDFDSFPGKTEEQETLVKFRLRRAVPFDIDSAALSYHAQPREGSKKVDVVASSIALETLARYEAPFRAAGLHVGLVTTSMLASLNAVPENGCRVLAKLNGLVLALAVVDNGALRLMRTIELPEVSAEAVAEHLFPTLTFIEDEWGRKPETVYAVGMDPRWLEPELTMEELRGPLGAAQPHNAGLTGWLAAGGRI